MPSWYEITRRDDDDDDDDGDSDDGSDSDDDDDDDRTSSSSRSSAVTIAATVVAVFVVLLLIILCFVHLKRKRVRRRKERKRGHVNLEGVTPRQEETMMLPQTFIPMPVSKDVERDFSETKSDPSSVPPFEPTSTGGFVWERYPGDRRVMRQSADATSPIMTAMGSSSGDHGRPSTNSESSRQVVVDQNPGAEDNDALLSQHAAQHGPPPDYEAGPSHEDHTHRVAGLKFDVV
ncbi:hypothetical protein PUNSTDRAFT_112870 [Punctularia strigosozonata HHB-11173 SS5]|uniref:uncharacterized protein n=1 Tax=Punctularia strigosozonata (strain HHB-11173) TaxID=741275 RepID=UPI00044164C4|nr:uncharacterized protein PUNSTDRAFT_112870 [Punctularia strigosozonata HHB-11173 SS5]EIN11121.1 hypothetical protein PUNSTDRAFT_112870 [Punctularia strigosozonata HHB-11173 SS5]